MKTLGTYRMEVAPLPFDRPDGPGHSQAPVYEGFVDEALVSSLISLPPAPAGVGRMETIAPADLVLSSDPDDFAGWSVPAMPPSPFRLIAERQERLAARQIVWERRAPEPGLGEPHEGRHRWWIAAAAGAASTVILSLLFFHLGGRTDEGRDLGWMPSQPLERIHSAMGALQP